MEEDKNKSKKRVNIGARTGMIAPVVALLATAIAAIYSYAQGYSLAWYCIIIFATFAVFLLIGSLLQTVIEIIVEKTIKREEEEKRLKEAGLIDDSILHDESTPEQTDRTSAAATAGTRQ